MTIYCNKDYQLSHTVAHGAFGRTADNVSSGCSLSGARISIEQTEL